MISPAKAGAAAHYIDDSLEFSVMMWAGLRVGMHHDRSRPELLRADPGMGDGFGAGHAGGLRSISVEFAAADDAQAISFPVGHFVFFHYCCRTYHHKPAVTTQPTQITTDKSNYVGLEFLSKKFKQNITEDCGYMAIPRLAAVKTSSNADAKPFAVPSRSAQILPSRDWHKRGR